MTSLDPVALPASERLTMDSAPDAGIWRAIAEQSPDVICRVDRALRYVYVNPAIERFGLARDEILGRTLVEAGLAAEQAATIDDATRLVLASGIARTVESELRTPAGAFHFQIQLIPEGNGSVPAHVLSYARDITERVAAERAARHAEQQFRALVEQVPAVMFLGSADESATPLYVSPQTRDLLGYGEEEWLARPDFWISHIHPEDLPRVQAEVERTNVTGEPFRAVYRFIAADGEPRWIQNDAVLIRDDAGAPLYWQGLMIDISERRRLFEVERAAREAAEASARGREEFLVLASHELKTPLTSIKALVQLLGRRALGPEPDVARARELRDLLEQQVTRVELLVNDLLDASRAQRGSIELRREHVDLVALARDVLDRIDPGAESHAAAPHLLQLVAPASVVGEWDPARLDQLLTHLVANALAYSPAGGRVRVTIAADPDAPLVRVAVSDEGIGITPEEQARLFTPFTRGADASRLASGSGLGLYIAAQIVARHHGTIAIDSTPGAGTTVEVALPTEL